MNLPAGQRHGFKHLLVAKGGLGVRLLGIFLANRLVSGALVFFAHMSTHILPGARSSSKEDELRCRKCIPTQAVL